MYTNWKSSTDAFRHLDLIGKILHLAVKNGLTVLVTFFLTKATSDTH